MIKKNKPLTIFLLVAVVAIYGSILYRSFSGQQTIDEVSNQTHHQMNNLSVNYQKDSFKIDFYLKDPFKSEGFLNKTKYSESPIVQPAKISPAKEIKKELIPDWPAIKYYGFVKNRSNKKGLYLISVNHELTKMKLGASYKNITLVNANMDSAVFRFNGEQKSIKK